MPNSDIDCLPESTPSVIILKVALRFPLESGRNVIPYCTEPPTGIAVPTGGPLVTVNVFEPVILYPVICRILPAPPTLLTVAYIVTGNCGVVVPKFSTFGFGVRE